MNDLHNLLRHLPPYEETPVFDLHHKRRGMETLSLRASRSPRTCDGGVAIWPRARAVPLRPAGGAAAAAGGGAVGVGEDLGRRFEALAQFWSGVRTRDSSFSSASATQAGCLIDSAPYGIVRPLAMRRPPASSLAPAAPASARGRSSSSSSSRTSSCISHPADLANGSWRSATPSASPRPSDAPGRAATPVGGQPRAQSRSPRCPTSKACDEPRGDSSS